MLFLVISACGQASEEESETDSASAGEGEVTEQDSVEEEDEADDAIPSDLEANPSEYPQFQAVSEDEIEVIMHTNMGEIHLKLFPEFAPKAVENFIALSEQGFYDGIIFHRVIENFMIQGGDPTGTGSGGESIFGDTFEDEFTTSLAHFHGALSMANRGPNTNSSQFFIVHADETQVNEEYLARIEAQRGFAFPEQTKERYLEVGGTPHLDFGHTVFGHVIGGFEVVNAIAGVEKGANDRPVEDVVIESVEIVQ
ncbi:peptidylprolyl isomerase [Bacillus tamaricis]|uniref:peptidylprolyl isomerase n=2 Tax=Evansella tamaricis TaxID=2069301 RepID=A0ABS6JPS7_9BACI|nr:peptidylprolyl isomerase [Evansella tamaricis]MBU9714817.1 peptidylprolyl isomerase [Evansella tamaricis]